MENFFYSVVQVHTTINLKKKSTAEEQEMII